MLKLKIRAGTKGNFGSLIDADFNEFIADEV